MKHIFVLLILLNSALGYAQTAEFNFLNPTTHDWNRVEEGVQLKHYFVFENSGNVPLVIDDAMVSCGCTKVEFPKNPILPSHTDSIFVRFDTKNKYYKQDRIIKLKANTQRTQKLRIKAYVVPYSE